MRLFSSIYKILVIFKEKMGKTKREERTKGNVFNSPIVFI